MGSELKNKNERIGHAYGGYKLLEENELYL